MTTKNKIYEKVQYSGNENHWHEPTKPLGKTSMPEEKADQLNQYFGSSGIKYVESDGKPYDNEQDLKPGGEGNSQNLIVKDGELKETDNKVADTAEEQGREVTDTVLSSGEIVDKESEVDAHSSVQFAPKVGTEPPIPEKREETDEKPKKAKKANKK